MKCLILTRVETSTEEKTLVNQSKLFKLAVNTANYKADLRLFHDSQYWQMYLDNYPETLVTRAKESLLIPDHARFIFYNDALEPCTENKEELYFEQSSLICSIDFAIKLGFTDILLVADNNVDNINFTKDLFESEINRIIKRFTPYANIYQFSDGNFDLPVMSVGKFLQVT